MNQVMVSYEVSFVKMEGGSIVNPPLKEPIQAVDDDHALDEFHARHPAGTVSWISCRVADDDEPDHSCPHCGSDNTRRLTADERECWDCKRTW